MAPKDETETSLPVSTHSRCFEARDGRTSKKENKVATAEIHRYKRSNHKAPRQKGHKQRAGIRENSSQEPLLKDNEPPAPGHDLISVHSPPTTSSATSLHHYEEPTSSQHLSPEESRPHIEVVVTTPRTPQGPPFRNPTNKPSLMSSSIFSFVVTVAFVCILWLVAVLVFGSRGHTLGGVFVALFFVGLLINTCFLKLYFRLTASLGSNSTNRTARRQSVAIQRHIRKQEKKAAERARENPPSYASAMALPPPYNLLQYYKQRKSRFSLASSVSRVSVYKRHHCPFCKKDVMVFGICGSCRNNLRSKQSFQF